MIVLGVQEVVQLHQKMILQSGGSAGLRDKGLLESAVLSVESSFDGIFQYPSVEEKAARYAFSLIKNHAFVDGNKRIGVHAMLVMLDVNGIELECDDEDVIGLGLNIATGGMDYSQILDWIREHQGR